MRLFIFGMISLMTGFCLGQEPVALASDISIKKIFSLSSDAIRIAHDPVSGNLFYARQNGSIYEVNLQNTSQTLRYTSSDHGQNVIQGFTIGPDGTFYVVGNAFSGGNDIGIIKRGKLENDQRVWSTVAESEPYLIPGGRDHLFNAIEVTPDGNYLIVNSGSRTDHGDSANGGREFPITSAYFKIPVDAENLTLYNNADSLATYLFADGLRNSFDMAFSGEGELFATENCGARDDAEELNWVREGHHYGFPWRQANMDNPQQFANFDPPDSDPLIVAGINMESTFHNDPTFPAKPEGIIFTDPVENIGPDADHFRDTTDAAIKDASEEGKSLYTFTPHSSPLAITFDKTNALAEPYTGDGFVMSYNDPALRKYEPFNDPGGDLLHLELNKIEEEDRYTAVITRIAEGFSNPVDNVIVDNKIYIIEYGSGSNLWEVTLPLATTALEPVQIAGLFELQQNYPNPFNPSTIIRYKLPQKDHVKLSVYNILGEEVKALVNKEMTAGGHSLTIDMKSLPSGIYFYTLKAGVVSKTRKMILIR